MNECSARDLTVLKICWWSKLLEKTYHQLRILSSLLSKITLLTKKMR